MLSCAICVEPIHGAPIFEPLGRDDGIVALCSRCATEEIEVKDPSAARRGQVQTRSRTVPNNPRAVRIREHRAELRAQGVCTNGANHGPVAVRGGSLCKRCLARRSKSRHKKRR